MKYGHVKTCHSHYALCMYLAWVVTPHKKLRKANHCQQYPQKTPVSSYLYLTSVKPKLRSASLTSSYYAILQCM